LPTDAQLHTVQSVFDAVALRDVDAALRTVTDDFELCTSAFITGERVFRGPEGVHHWFELVDGLTGSGERVTLRPYRYLGDRADPEVIVAVVSVTIGRPEGDEIGTEAAYLFGMSGERVAIVRGFMDYNDGLAELKEPFELA
jgi:ketosteroid isomerase-like protein